MANASLESQLGHAPCEAEDTADMFVWRYSDDYQSRFRLAGALAGQYRFREAAECCRKAAAIRDDDPELYRRLGGCLLTLRRFGEAEAAYRRSAVLSGSEKSVDFPMGMFHYLRGEYEKAAARFSACLPCGDELAVAVLYWHCLCRYRQEREPELAQTYREDMQAGHHAAYRTALSVFAGKTCLRDALDELEKTESELDIAILAYGLSIYLRRQGEVAAADKLREDLLTRCQRVWPCVAYLAAWGDALEG